MSGKIYKIPLTQKGAWAFGTYVVAGLAVLAAIYGGYQAYLHYNSVKDQINIVHDSLVGAPDSVCNSTNPQSLICYSPYSIKTNLQEQMCATTNVSMCNLQTLFLELTASINISLIVPPVPDNQTITAIAQIPLLVLRILPGATTTVVNNTYPISQIISFKITYQATNMTQLQMENVFYALQYGSFLYFWNLPVTITSWNTTENSGTTVPYNPVCTLQGYNYPTQKQCDSTTFCANWMNNAICICNFPYYVRRPGTAICDPNPCWATGGIGVNGGCVETKMCIANMFTSPNRTCT